MYRATQGAGYDYQCELVFSCRKQARVVDMRWLRHVWLNARASVTAQALPVSGIATASYCAGTCKRVAIYASFGMVARAFVWLWLGRTHDWNLRPARTTMPPPQVRISAARGQHRRALTLNFGGPFQASKMGGSFATEWCRPRLDMQYIYMYI